MTTATQLAAPPLAAAPWHETAHTIEPGRAMRSADFDTAFTELFPQISGYARRLVGTEDAARDIAQEALARTWARWLSVRDPRSYAFLVATNLVREQWRQAPSRRRALEQLALDAPSAAAAHDNSVRDVVDRLDRKYREVVLLHYFADLSVDEIARVLGRPAGSVKQRLHHARQLLAADLGGTR